MRFAALVASLAFIACDGGGGGQIVDPPVPTTITAGSSTSLTGVAGSPVAPSPSVVVKDQNGAGIAGVPVAFAVATGGGSVSEASVTTDASGVATLGAWTLGSQAGSNSLTATAATLPAVTFTANSVSAACATRTAVSVGTTAGSLTTSDCQLSDGTYVDFFTTTVGGPNAYLIQQSASFDSYLFLATADGSVIAENDDQNDTSTNSAIKALLPAGSYVIGASSFNASVTGDYSISTSTTSGAVSGCELVYVVKNVTTAQTIEDTDCLRSTAPAPPLYADSYFIFLRAGQSMTVTMTSPALDSYIELVRLDGTRVASNDNKDATSKDAQVIYTATSATYYAIFARTAVDAQTGAYTLSIQ